MVNSPRKDVSGCRPSSRTKVEFCVLVSASPVRQAIIVSVLQCSSITAAYRKDLWGHAPAGDVSDETLF